VSHQSRRSANGLLSGDWITLDVILIEEGDIAFAVVIRGWRDHLDGRGLLNNVLDVERPREVDLVIVVFRYRSRTGGEHDDESQCRQVEGAGSGPEDREERKGEDGGGHEIDPVLDRILENDPNQSGAGASEKGRRIERHCENVLGQEVLSMVMVRAKEE
jgi:hypothetical protein